MLSFKEFIKESVSTMKRSSIPHFQDMKDSDFLDLINSLNHYKGILSQYSANLKIDGFSFKFGKDENGKIFVESANSGPIFKDNIFSNFAKLNRKDSPESQQRSKSYDRLFKLFKSIPWMKDLPDNTKIYCEIFFNEMATKTKDGLKFVTLEYDSSKLGKVLTIMPYQVFESDSGDPNPDYREILDWLYKQSTPDIKIINTKLETKPIDLSSLIKSILNMREGDPRLKAEKDRIANYILNSSSIKGKDILGKNSEGIVINIKGQNWKITTPEYKEAKGLK